MKNSVLLVILLLTCYLSSSGQYNTPQNKKWNFGNGVGINFNSGSPVAITSSINATEGNASVCDGSGNLLFYTDGKTVWTKTGAIMPSGSSIVSFGTGSASQAAVIVPTISNPNQYYIFSLESTGGTPSWSHLAWSVVDMTLNSGLGDVVAASAGTALDNSLSEKMIAIPGNNCNIWLVVHAVATGKFLAYEINASGISSTSVASTTGTLTGYETGVIKAAHNRLKIVSATYSNDKGTELYDFDPNTGIVSNCKVLDNTLPAYGAEFSADDSKLYVTEQKTVGANFNLQVVQYDATLATAAAILASKATIVSSPYTGPVAMMRDLKLAPDNKIYLLNINAPNTTFMDCIAAPNLAGGACNYTGNMVGFFNTQPNVAGLPNTYLVAGGGAVTGSPTACVGGTTTLSGSIAGGTWSSGAIGTATVGSATGVVTGVATGTVNITYTIGTGCAVTTVVTVTTGATPISGPTLVCEGATTSLSDGTAGGTWSCSNTAVGTVGVSTGVVAAISGGTTTITYSLSAGCTITTVVTVFPIPDGGVVSGPSTMCTESTITLTDPVPGGVWSVTNARATIAPSGTTCVVTGVLSGSVTISYTISNACGADAGTQIIEIGPMPDPGIITGLSKVCVGSSITVDDVTPGGVWSNDNSKASITSTGSVTGLSGGIDTIKYTITNSFCSASAIKVITVNALPDSGTISGLASICKGGFTTYTENVPGGTWSSAGFTAVIGINPATGKIAALGVGQAIITYTTPTDGDGCLNTATFTVNVLAAASFTLSGTVTDLQCNGANDGSIVLIASNATPPLTYQWSNGSTTPTISGVWAGQYTVQVKETSTLCIKADTFHIAEPTALSLTTTVTKDKCGLALGAISASIAGGVPPYQYLWSNNGTGTEVSGLIAGTYSLTVTDANACVKIFPVEVTDTGCNDLVIADVLTPNGDGINDVWVIQGLHNYPGNTVQVFDKWGDMVFEAKGYNNSWTGISSKGQQLPDGTYFYLLKLNATNAQGGKNEITGSVLIKR